MDDEMLEKGDWIVHGQHGVGQIEAIEEKKIGENIEKYFRVKVSRGVYWLPISKVPDYVRSVSSSYKFRKVLKIIREEHQELLTNYKERNRQIAEKLENASIETIGELIRDLDARRHIDSVKLSAVNERQLAELRQQFLREMTVVLEIEMEEAEKKLDKALKKSMAKFHNEEKEHI